MTNKKEEGHGVGLGLGIAALAAAAVGAYFLYGSEDGADNRKKVKGWMLKMRGEILERLEDLKEISEDTYNNVIDEVSARYEELKNIDRSELVDLRDELKAHWIKIADDVETKSVSKKKK